MEGPEVVDTQVLNGQIPCHKDPKKQQPSGRQAAQETGNAANHPASWGGGTRGWSWEDDSQDTPPAPAQKEDGLNNKEEDGPADGNARAHDIVAATLAELAWEGGGAPALNIVRFDHGYDVKARALAALRDNRREMSNATVSTTQTRTRTTLTVASVVPHLVRWKARGVI